MKSHKALRRDAAMKLYRTESPKFRPVDLVAERANQERAPYIPAWFTRVYRNNQFFVMIDDNRETTNGHAICAMVQKHDDTPIKNHWMTMQKIKNEIFGPEVMAIEYYPKQSELVDDHNIYWMWIFPEGIIPKKVAR